MILGGVYKGPCPKDCPNRGPECHNAKTCAIWAAHEKKKQEQRERNKERFASRRMSWEQRKANESR